VIRQAHTYLAGAVSGTALIATAIVAFVVLVSLQAVRDWPLANIGGDDQTGVSAAQPAAHAAGSVGGEAAAGRRSGALAAGARGGRRAHGAGSKTGNAALGTPPASAEGSPAGSPRSTDGGVTGGGSGPSGAPSSGSSGGGGGSGQGGDSAPATSESVAGTVNKTVSGIDSATGGSLGEAGVTKVSEETAGGVVGLETPLGKTVEKAAETVGGLLGGSGQ